MMSETHFVYRPNQSRLARKTGRFLSVVPSRVT